MKVLIVDDNPTNRKLLRAILEGEGFSTLEATDGLDALSLLEREPIDAIISDILMPNMDGYRLCHEVRKSERFCQLPFIVYTNTFTSPGDEKVARELGADCYLKKPSPAAEILAALRDVSYGGPRRHPKPTRPEQELALMKTYSEQLVDKLEEKNIQLMRQAEELRASEERSRRLAAIVESSEDAIIGKSLDGTITSWNAAATRLYGYTAEEALGQHISILFPPDHQAEWRALTAKVARGEPVASFETVRLHKDGSRVEVSTKLSPIKSPDGQVVGVSTLVRNISARKRAEGALRETQRRFAAFMENLPGFAWMKDAGGRYLYINKMLSGLARYQGDALGKTDADLWPSEVARLYAANDQKVISSREALQVVEPYSVEGEQRYVLVSKFPIFDETGAVAVVGGISVDITDRIKADEALHELSARLLKVQDQERRRIARELHDSTAQKLAALIMNLEMVANKITEERPEEKRIIDDSLVLLESCSQEVRTLSYLLHPPLLDDLGLAVALRVYVEGFSKRSGISVELVLPRDLEALGAEIDLVLFRVVQESLGNVHRHSGSATAAVRLSRGPENVMLEVTDHGTGLPLEKIALASERSARLGVGVAGMRERVRQLGGQFNILSGKQGTTVRAIIPLAGQARKAANEKEHP